MPYDTAAGDFGEITSAAKKSPEFGKMTGKEPDADDSVDSDEAASFGEAWQAAQDGSRDEFVASMIAGVRACIANYGAGKE